MSGDELVQVARALRTLADEDAHREAPASVEAAVVAAWRAQRQQDHAPDASVVESPPLPAWRPGIGAGIRWAAAAAAVATFALASAMLIRDERSIAPRQDAVDPSRSASGVVAPATAPASGAAAAAPVNRPSVSTGGSKLRDARRGAAAARGPSDVARAALGDTIRRAPGTTPESAAASASRSARQSATSGATGSATPGLADAADERPAIVFVQLPYAEPLRPTEMRQVVRVTVPEATIMLAGLSGESLVSGGALVSGGTSLAGERLPSGEEAPPTQDVLSAQGGSSGTGPRPGRSPSDGFAAGVLADVLIGEDGVARGIRLVQQNTHNPASARPPAPAGARSPERTPRRRP